MAVSDWKKWTIVGVILGTAIWLTAYLIIGDTVILPAP